jgi:hypothetical protein
MTHSIDIFLAAHQAIAAGVHMIPRSTNDKEYFPQDRSAASRSSSTCDAHQNSEAWTGNPATRGGTLRGSSS